MTDDECIIKAKAIARTLTYNEAPESHAKAMLHELCSRLDSWQRQPLRRAWRLWVRRLKRRVRYRLGLA